MGWADLRADHGNIDVMNSFGGLSAESVKGDIKASMSRRVSADSRLKASVGDVWVDVDPESALHIAATTSWGEVHSAFNFGATEGETTASRLKGSLNGGGPLLSLQASGGDVKIYSVNTYGM